LTANLTLWPDKIRAMRIHQISVEQLTFMGIPLPVEGVCMYEAEDTDIWRGYMAGRPGWTGGGPLPGLPASTYHGALEAFKAALEGRSKPG
jgi:hypothetical protein